MRIEIVGLGPGDPEELTIRAAETLLSGRRVLLRTGRHPVSRWLKAQGVEYATLDALYDTAEDFDSLAEQAAAAVAAAADEAERMGLAPLVYGVPGQGWLEEDIAPLLEQAGLTVSVIPGLPVSLVPPQPYPDWTAGVTVLPATHLDRLCHRTPGGLIVTQLDDGVTAGEVKLALSALWGDEAQVQFIDGQGVSHTIALYELDWQEGFDHNARLVLSAPAENVKQDMDDLREIAEILRAPMGCPWDRAQTHQSLSRYMLEEALEVQDAIAREDMEALSTELGDVLLQVVLHASLAAEEDAFSLEDVTDAICKKMIRRHPQLFGLGETADWETLKRRETGERTVTASMEGLASTLPSLLRAEKVQYKAGQVGFDWDNAADAMDKVLEEAGEVLSAPPEEVAEEVGDLLFSCVNVARLLGVEPESALRAATRKFICRFGRMEALASERGTPLSGLSLEEMNTLWDRVKEDACD